MRTVLTLVDHTQRTHAWYHDHQCRNRRSKDQSRRILDTCTECHEWACNGTNRMKHPHGQRYHGIGSLWASHYQQPLASAELRYLSAMKVFLLVAWEDNKLVQTSSVRNRKRRVCDRDLLCRSTRRIDQIAHHKSGTNTGPRHLIPRFGKNHKSR
jgi:hypothetical protein